MKACGVIVILMAMTAPVNFAASTVSRNIIIGDYYLEQNNATQALRYYSNALQEERSPLTLNRVGFAYYKEGNFQLARQYYLLALAISNTVPYIYNNLGVLYYNERDYALAITNYLKALSLRADYTRVMVNLAVAYFYSGDYQKAYYYYRLARTTDSDYVEQRLDVTRAKQQLADLVRENPDDEELRRIYDYVMSHY